MIRVHHEHGLLFHITITITITISITHSCCCFFLVFGFFGLVFLVFADCTTMSSVMMMIGKDKSGDRDG